MNSTLFFEIYRWLLKPARRPNTRAYGVERLEPRTVLSASGFADGPPHYFVYTGHQPLPHHPAIDFGRPSMSGHLHDTRGERFPPPLFGRPAWEPNRQFPPPIETNKSSPVVPAAVPNFEPLHQPVLNVPTASPAQRSSPIFSQPIELAIDLAGKAGHTALPAIRPSTSGGSDLKSVDIVFAELADSQDFVAERSPQTSDVTNGNWLMIPLIGDDWSLGSWKEVPRTDDEEGSQPSIVRQPGKPQEDSADNDRLIEMEADTALRLKRKSLSAGGSPEDHDETAAQDLRTRLNSKLAAARFTDRPLLEWLPIAEGHEFGDAQAVAPEDDGLLELQVLTASAAITALLRSEALPSLELAAIPEGTLEASLELYQAFETADATADELPFDSADLPLDQPQHAEPTATSMTLVK